MGEKEVLQIFDDLVADYLSGAGAASDYTMLANALRHRTGLPLATVLETLATYAGVPERRAALEEVRGISGWTPRPGADTLAGGGSGRGATDDSRFLNTQGTAPPPKDPLLLDPQFDWETPGRERLPEDLFGQYAAQRGAIANFVRDNFGDNVSGAFRNFLTNRGQQDALESRFQLASTADPQGAEGGFSKFMQGLAPEMFRTSGPNRGQLDLLSRYLATPNSGAYDIPVAQRDAIEGFRTDQQKQFDLLMNPLIANLSPYSTGGFARSAQAHFDDWIGRNLDNPNAQYLPYIAGRNFVP